MRNYLEEIRQNVNLDEGQLVIEQMLHEVYFKKGISTKELARKLLLPLPLVAAIKKEFIKLGVLKQDRGVRLTPEGKEFIEEKLGFKGIDYRLYDRFMDDMWDWETDLGEELEILTKMYDARPQVDVTIDQSKCTPETGLQRAILCLQNNTLIGKNILCVGDDDLISVAIGLLVKKIFPREKRYLTQVHVIDIDERILKYITELARLENLPIQCHHVDLRKSLPDELEDKFDCFFTDPPYTLQGMSLFLSRGIDGLKKEVGLPIFLSFAHKSPDVTLIMQKEFVKMGIMISEIIPRFNEYEGAEIIGNTGQIFVMKTTKYTKSRIDDTFEDPIYTGEMRRTVRTYKCKGCGDLIKVGYQRDFKTIEKLKNNGCPVCKGGNFDLIDKTVVKRNNEN
ncbi:MAG: bis-aminopropyl spermidine synthase family protein [Halanaerobiales bacterium]|nr:bis-aminopropyl spermidine synthase family protein [Halanaerobiales bacterium]